MPLFLVARASISIGEHKKEWALIGFKEVKAGKHVIGHNQFSVPITILQDEVIVHIESAKGELHNATITAFGDSWCFIDRNSIKEISFKLEADLKALHIYSGDDENNSFAVLLEWHPEQPEVYTLPNLSACFT